MLDRRRILIYNEHWIRPKRWYIPILKCRWTKKSSMRIIIRVKGWWKENDSS